MFWNILLFECFEFVTNCYRDPMRINEFADQALKSIDHYVLDHHDPFLFYFIVIARQLINCAR